MRAERRRTEGQCVMLLNKRGFCTKSLGQSRISFTKEVKETRELEIKRYKYIIIAIHRETFLKKS